MPTRLCAAILVLINATNALSAEDVQENSSADKNITPSVLKVVFQDKSKASGLSESVAYEVICEGFKIAEGPIWDHANNQLLFSDVNSNEIHRWSVGRHGVFGTFREHRTRQPSPKGSEHPMDCL